MADRQLLHRTPEGLRLEISSPKGIVSIFFSSVMLLTFPFVVRTIVSDLLSGIHGATFNAIVVLIMVSTFLSLVPRLLWELFGRETVWITSGGITFRNHLFWYGKAIMYTGADCSDFRSVTPIGPRAGQIAVERPRSFARLAFDYKTKTIYFGFGLTESEANQVVAEIGSLYPDYLGVRNPAVLPLIAGEPTNLEFQRLAWDGYELRLEPRREVLLGATVSGLLFLAFLLFFAVQAISSFSLGGIVIAVLLSISLFVTGSQERVVFSRGQIRIGRTLLISMFRTYESQYISGIERNMRQPTDPELTPTELRLSRDFGSGEGYNAYGNPSGNPPSFRFDYKGKKITFGRNLQEAEARIILATIQTYFPEYFKDQ